MTDHIVHIGGGKTVTIPDHGPKSKNKEKLAKLGVMYRRRQAELEVQFEPMPIYAPEPLNGCQWPLENGEYCMDKTINSWSSYCRAHDDLAHNRKPLRV